MNKEKVNYLHLFYGFLLGTVELIPGFSAGTMALILKIYGRLVKLLNYGTKSLIFDLIKLNFKNIFKGLDLLFSIPLAIGMLSSILILSQFIHWLLENYSVYFYYFIFIFIESYALMYLLSFFKKDFIKPQLKKSDASHYLIILMVSTLIAFILIIGFNGSFNLEPTQFNLLLSGFLGSFAMVLPSISGSYVLLIMGTYEEIIFAIKSLDILKLSIFILGFFPGLLVSSELMKWLLKINQMKVVLFFMNFILLYSFSLIIYRLDELIVLINQIYSAVILILLTFSAIIIAKLFTKKSTLNV